MRCRQTFHSCPRASQRILYRRRSGSRSDSLPSPSLVEMILPEESAECVANFFVLRITNKNSSTIDLPHLVMVGAAHVFHGSQRELQFKRSVRLAW